MGGEVVYAPNMEYIVMGAQLLITAIKRHRSVPHDGLASRCQSGYPPAQSHAACERQSQTGLQACMLSPRSFPTACSEEDAAAAALRRRQGASDAAAGDTCAISGRRCACWILFAGVLRMGFQESGL